MKRNLGWYRYRIRIHNSSAPWQTINILSINISSLDLRIDAKQQIPIADTAINFRIPSIQSFAMSY